MALKNKKGFITGVTGFVGSHMAKYLLGEGAIVFSLVRRKSDGSPARLMEACGRKPAGKGAR